MFNFKKENRKKYGIKIEIKEISWRMGNKLENGNKLKMKLKVY